MDGAPLRDEALKPPPADPRLPRPAAASPRPRGALAGAVLVLALWGALAVALYRRNAVWVSQHALWEDALSKTRCSPRAHLSLGYSFREARRYPEAIAEYRKGLACASGNADMEVQLLRNLGAAYMYADRYDDAAAVLKEALEKSSEDPEILTNLAVVWLGKRDLPLARVYAKRALAQAPSMGYAWNALGIAQMEEGDLAAARASLERAVELDPDAGVRGYNLGKVLDRQGDRPAACRAWRRALQGFLEDETRRQALELIGTGCAGASGGERR